MNERVPTILRSQIDQFLLTLDRFLPGLVKAFYLVGSIAQGEFNSRLSDVDFVAVLGRPPSPDDVKTLLQLHLDLENEHPNWKLEGMYFQLENVGRPERTVPPYLSYHDRRLRIRQEAHLTIVTWWILKNHGIPVTGPDPRELPFTVDWEELIAQMHENFNNYWARWTDRPIRLLSLFSDYYVQWAVLGVLRQFYSFREGRITTKIKAGEYALACLPERFRPIIREAIALRQVPRVASTYRSRLLRAVHAVRLLN